MRYFQTAKLLSVACEPTDQLSIKITNADAAERLFRSVWPADMDIRETFVVMYMNRQNDPLAYFIVSVGGITSTVVDPRMVFAPALTLSGCTAMILAHCHPSGAMAPSDADRELTKQLVAGAKLFEWTIVDHLILAPESGRFSFAEQGLI